MSSTSKSAEHSGDIPREWQYPSSFLVELDGGYIHPAYEGGGTTQWVFDQNLKGPFFKERVDSIGRESTIGPVEAKKAELAFRNGFFGAARTIVAEFGSATSSGEAYAWLVQNEKQAQVVRERQLRAGEVAQPFPDWPYGPGLVLYAIGHWVEEARQRGVHHAWTFVRQDWVYLDGTTEYRARRSGYCPNCDSLDMLRDLALPKWLEDVEAWYATPDDRWPPPRPIGRRVGIGGLIPKGRYI